MTIDLSILDDEILAAVVEDLIPFDEDFPYPVSLHRHLVEERQRRKAGTNEPGATIDVRTLEGAALYRSAHRTLLTAVIYQQISKPKVAAFFLTIHNELLKQIIAIDGAVWSPCETEGTMQ